MAVNVNMKLIFAIPILVVVSRCCIPTVLGNHLPEDSKLRDDGVALVREKRDNFIDRILKSIPFFHMESPPNVLEEEPVEPFDDDDAAADDDDDDGAVMSASVSDIPMTSSVTPLRSSMVLSASVPVTSTPWADQSEPSIIMMSTVSSVASTPLPSASVSFIKTSSAILNSPLLTSSVSSMKLSGGTRELLNSFMSANAPVDSNITG